MQEDVIKLTLGELDFDPDELKAKYLAERDKRLRSDGNEQYIEVQGDFSDYVDDPYEKKVAREPLNDTVEIVIIGGGFGGLLLGGRLREQGFTDIRVIEKGGDFGGTWYWNRYPGAMCDVESYCYLPMLEELDYIPKNKYSFAPEIMAHTQNIAKHYDLYNNACMSTEVTDMTWDEKEEYWIVSTNRGDRMRARYVAMANGPLNRPKLPGIPGIDSFKGHTFHTSRWDYDYTGGDASGGLEKLKDKGPISVLNKIKEEVEKDNEQLKESLMAWAKENSVPIGTLMQCFRLALVGKLTGPDLFEICNLLGKELSLKRIDDLIKYINLKLT